jgi:hypothetical protein
MTLHLVVDEEVTHHNHRFRVRIWQCSDLRPGLVLLSQVAGGVPPDWFSAQLTNRVLRAFLGYPADIPGFYELSRWDGQTRAFRVTYDTIGCHLRPILVNPHYTPLDPQALGRLLGVPLESPN